MLAVSDQPDKVMALFTNLPDKEEILAQGPTKSSIRLKLGIQVDLRVVKEKEFGSALLYFTGSKQHNNSITVSEVMETPRLFPICSDTRSRTFSGGRKIRTAA